MVLTGVRLLSDWDISTNGISISKIKEILDTCGPGSHVNLLNVSKEELEFLKATMDCYCNVGEKIIDLEKKIIALSMNIESMTASIMQELRKPTNPYQTATYKQQQINPYSNSITGGTSL